MKSNRSRQLFLFLAFLFFLPLCSHAGESIAETQEGILQEINQIPGEPTRIKLDENWYSVSTDSDIYVCGKKRTSKSTDNLNEYINNRINISPSASGTYTKIHVMCE